MDFNNNERNNQDPNKRKKNKTNLLICLMAALFAIGLIFFLNSEIQRNTEKEITYTNAEKGPGEKGYISVEYDCH